MRVELSIKDDSELRNMIKDMIRGQITGIVREEITQIIGKVVEEKIHIDVRGITECKIEDRVTKSLSEYIWTNGLSIPNKIQRLAENKINSLVNENVEIVLQRKNIK